MSTLRAGQKISKLWKDGWVYIPEIMAAHILSTIGIVGIIGINIYIRTSFNPIVRSYEKPLFFRPDDPRAKKTLTYYEEGWHERENK